MHEQALARLHYLLIDGLLQRGVCPDNSQIAEAMRVSASDVENLLRDLAAIHGVVLHPRVSEPWIVHPFSLTPTLNWIESERASWWAPCVWCALGVAALAGGRVGIHTRFGAEGEALTIEVNDGVPEDVQNVFVHFAVPPARAWDNVHQHCSLVLPFHSTDDVRGWCERHGLSMGEVVPLIQVARLARLWYGRHADPDWRKWSIAEAQDIFTQAGLTSDFWRLESRAGKF